MFVCVFQCFASASYLHAQGWNALRNICGRYQITVSYPTTVESLHLCLMKLKNLQLFSECPIFLWDLRLSFLWSFLIQGSCRTDLWVGTKFLPHAWYLSSKIHDVIEKKAVTPGIITTTARHWTLFRTLRHLIRSTYSSLISSVTILTLNY